MKNLFITLFFLVLGSNILSQTPEEFEFKMANNGLMADKVPYGKRFIIKGNAKINQADTAEKIQLLIIDIKKSENRKSDSVVCNLSWNNKGLSSDFEFIVSPLKMNKKFNFILNVYEKFNPDYEDLTIKTIRKAKLFFDDPNGSGTLKTTDINSIIKVTLKEMLNETNEISYFNNIGNEIDFIKNDEKVLKDYLMEIFTGENDLTKLITDNKTDIESKIRNILKPIASYQSEAYTHLTSTESERIRFGSTIGAGTTFLSIGYNTEIRPFSYMAVKYYILPVDKTIPSQFYNMKRLNRLSILFGASLGRIKYKGTELEQIFGVNPVLGLSFDFDKYRFTSLDFGVIFFEQKSLSSIDSKTNFRFAPFITLSLDFDVFNRIKNFTQDKNE